MELFSTLMVSGQHLCESLDLCFNLSFYVYQMAAGDPVIMSTFQGARYERGKRSCQVHSFLFLKKYKLPQDHPGCVSLAINMINTTNSQGVCRSEHLTGDTDTPNKNQSSISKEGEIDME